MNILTEASGSLVTGYLLRAIQAAEHRAIASDITEECAARYLADDYIVCPGWRDAQLWEKMEKLLAAHRVDAVFPSFDETLLGWAERREHFAARGVTVIVSPVESVRICQDKWLTYRHFVSAGIPTPKSSLSQDFGLVKPRRSRGGAGVQITDAPVPMEGMISQEPLAGQEYTVDVFCDREGEPVYIIPRKRLDVRDGKSTAGVTEFLPEIDRWSREICRSLKFAGPINLQCFVHNGEVRFTEINPRVAGGMALGFAASENWLDLAVRHFIQNEPCKPKPVVFGMKMFRTYAEVFVSPD